MKVDPRIITALNSVLKFELTAINQYFLHARMFRHWGLDELNDSSYKKSIDDMRQSDKLIDRILFLEGLPNLQDLGKIYLGEDTEDILKCDMKLQTEQVALLRDAIALCEAHSDYVSRDLLENILEAEEEHIDWLESQQYLIENAGLQNYLQSKMSDGD